MHYFLFLRNIAKQKRPSIRGRFANFSRYLSKNAKAIRAFRLHKERLKALRFDQTESWNAIAADLIKKYLGPESEMMIHFNSSYGLFYDPHQHGYDLKQAAQIMDDCIHAVSINGAHETGNFLSRLSDTWLSILLGSVLISVVGFSYQFGIWQAKNTIEADKIKLEQENRQLKDSLNRQLQKQKKTSVRPLPTDTTHSIH